ncbi:hypothetical protein MHU86_20917 [Fragilaria crotonensis]|nr:hypothetical protein MHU86_20917 [Fragilaria crotonensis]
MADDAVDPMFNEVVFANPVPNPVHNVLNMCGVTVPATHLIFIDIKGLDTIDAFANLNGDSNITEMARTLTRRPVFCQVLFQIYTQALTWIMQIAILLVRDDMSVRWIRTLGAEAVAGCVVIAAVSVNKLVVDMAAVGVMAEVVDKAAATKRCV